MLQQSTYKILLLTILLLCGELGHAKSVRQQLKVHHQPRSRSDGPDDDGVRDKREGLVDVLPHAMRGFASNIGKGLSSMMHHGNNIGQKVAGIVKSAPNVMYGNWKPIYPSDPHYSKPSYKPPPESFHPPVSDFRPLSTYSEPQYPSIPTYSQPQITYGAFKPVQTSYEPVQHVSESYHLPPVTYGPPQLTYPPIQTGFKPIQTGYQPVQSSYQPVQSSYEPAQTSYEPAQTSYEPVQPIYEPVQSSYAPVQTIYEPVQTSYEPVQSSYGPLQPEQESYGSPIASPIAPIIQTPVSVNPLLPASPSANLVDPADDPIPAPLRTSSPPLSPLPEDPNFMENILDHGIFRHDTEKFRTSFVRFTN